MSVTASAPLPADPPGPRSASASAGGGGPGWRLLAGQSGTDDPLDLPAQRHPPGAELHRLARALHQTATELDAAFARAQYLRDAARQLRTAPTASVPCAEADGEVVSLAVIATRLECGLSSCELLDTALIRLLAVYEDTGPAPHGKLPPVPPTSPA